MRSSFPRWGEGMGRAAIVARCLVSLALAGCWIVSIGQPVAVTVAQNGEQTWSGDAILLMGWLGPLMLQFAWLANLLLPCVLVLAAMGVRSGLVQKLSIVCALMLAVLALNALFWSQIPMDNGSNPIVRFQIGYTLWLAAMFGGAAWGLVSTMLAMREQDV